MVQMQLHPDQTAKNESLTVVKYQRRSQILLCLNALVFLLVLWHWLEYHQHQQSQQPDSLSLSQLSALSESCKQSLMFRSIDFSQRPSR